MYLSKRDREELRMRFAGRCAYCGHVLGSRWHADHVEPVQRIGKWVNGKYTSTGQMWKPENDNLANLMPACVPCNIDKGPFQLEAWRTWLMNAHDRLLRNYSAYKHAHRFGLITPTQQPLQFFFEKYEARTPLLIDLQ